MTERTERTRRITTEPIGPLLARLTGTMIMGVIAMMTLGFVDTWFISLLGTNQLAAIGFIIPVYMIYVSIALGIGMGISSITSRLIGEGRHGKAARYVTDAQLLGLLFSIVIAVLLGVSISAVFSAMGATETVLPHIRDYMYILVLGLPVIMIAVISGNTFRAIGAIKTSALMSTLMAVLNLVLDPLLIFGPGPFPELGMKGAAAASVIAAAATAVVAVYILATREKLLLFTLPRLHHIRDNWEELLHIAIPAMLANMMTPLAAAIMTAMIAGYGAEAVAGFGVGARIETLCLLVVFALSATLPMFIGQNLGAGKSERVHRALFGCLKFSIGLQVAVYILLILLSPYIAPAFSSDPDVMRVINSFIYILPLTYGAHAIVILVMVSLNVLRRPRLGLLLIIIRLVALYLPLAYIGSLYWGITGLFAGAATGNVIAGIIAYRVISKVCASEDSLVPATA